jgi:2-polyprenyl-3-methyl-5-hydroxy-6-metoxy-1,4-benzoquinol methylase
MTSIKDSGSHVANTYSDDYFYGGAAGYPNYLDEKDILIRRGHYYAKLLSKHIEKLGKVLDVGAAAGFILKGFIDNGWEGRGIEVNDNMASYGRVNLGLDIQTIRIEDCQIQDTFNLINFIQVIAHLIDPFDALKRVSKVLSDKGYILIETWDYRSLTAKLFGRRWHEYSPPSVVQWFSKESLNYLMRSLHFDFIAAGRPDKRLSFKHAKSLIKYKLKNSVNFRFINFLLRLFPDVWTVRYPGNDLFWALYRKK